MLYAPKMVFTKIIPETDTRFAIPFSPILDPSSLLLHMNGLNASTSFPDNSGHGHVVTANGAAKIDTSQSVFGNGSASFDGNVGTFLSVTNNMSDFNFPGDYTIDFRIRPTALSFIPVHSDPSLALPTRYWIQVFADGTINFTIGGAAVITSAAGAIAINIWSHVAVARASGTTQLFVGGISQGAPYVGTESLAVGTAFALGARGDGGAFNLNGWMDEARVVNGLAVWTTNFTPPTSPYTPPPP